MIIIEKVYHIRVLTLLSSLLRDFIDKNASYINIADYIKLNISEKPTQPTTKETLK